MNKLKYTLWVGFSMISFYGCGLLNHKAKEVSWMFEKSENFKVTDTLTFNLRYGDDFYQTLPLFYFLEFSFKDSTFWPENRDLLIDTLFSENDSIYYLNNANIIALTKRKSNAPPDSFSLEYQLNEFNTLFILDEVGEDSVYKYRYKVINRKYSEPIWNTQEGFWCRYVWFGVDWNINEVRICQESGPIHVLRRIE